MYLSSPAANPKARTVYDFDVTSANRLVNLFHPIALTLRRSFSDTEIRWDGEPVGAHFSGSIDRTMDW
jgi:hypothetical protein